MAETKKKIKPGAMALHPEDLAILVNYEVGGHTSYPNLADCASACAPRQPLLCCLQVQEVQIFPDGQQQVVSREQTHKK